MPDSFAFFYVLYLRAKPIPNRTFQRGPKVDQISNSNNGLAQSSAKLTDKLTDKLADNPANLTDKLADNPAKLAAPYIENSNNGIVTERTLAHTRARGLIPKKLLLEAVDESFINRTSQLNLADGFPLSQAQCREK